MKNILKYFLLIGFSLCLITACKKAENKIYYEGGTAPTLTASSTSAMALDITHKTENALTLSWTNPNYKFTTGLSSHGVTYSVQFDTTGDNFNHILKEVVIANDLSKTFTVGEINGVLLDMGLVEGLPHDVEMRVKTTVENALPLYSNVVKIRITPYLDVKYPVPANLYITGSATPASWQCGCGEPELLSQKFTKINASTFRITIPLSANNSYLLIPVYGDWGAKYGGVGASNNSNNVNGDDFKPNGSDLKAPATSGTYTITVDFKTGKFTVQ